jgi:HPt (histidine-containing phosphotransfer) domain-containing protein
MKTIQLDKGVLQNLYGDCQDSMIEIFSDFLTDFTETRQNLSSAFDSGNLSSLKRVLHFHGPSFMYLGLPEVAALFKSLEQKCAQVDNHFSVSKDFEELVQILDGSWMKVKNEMEHLKKAV